MDNILQDAHDNKKEIWMLFQDMSKAYDRVNLFMLQHAMNRLKLPVLFIRFITNLFISRKNRVFTEHGLTDPYNLLVGIDQGEVICPLLWCIYYDPLLSFIQKSGAGYTQSFNWFDHINDTNNIKVSKQLTVPNAAFIDDTTWIAHTKVLLEQILNIADSFYRLNDILINNDKAVLISNNPQHNNQLVQFNINNSNVNIKVEAANTPVRVLGVWMTVNRQKSHIIEQIKKEIDTDVQLLYHKKVTDKQLLYIFNAVIVPRLEYRSQLTFISEAKYESLTAPFRVLFKHKMRMNKNTPNSMLHNNLIYHFRKLFNNQIQAMFTNLCVQLNDNTVVGISTIIRVLQLQKKLFLNKSPLISWPFTMDHQFRDHIAELLTVLPAFGLGFALSEDSAMNLTIKGGRTHLLDVLPEKLYIKSLPSIVKSNTMFVDQTLSINGIYMITWQDRKTYYEGKFNRAPNWFKTLEDLIIENKMTTRRLKSQWIVAPQVPQFNNAIFFNNGHQYKSWTSFWSQQYNQMIVGKIIKSLNNEILVEHWNFVYDNDNNSPSKKKFLIQLCNGCPFNDQLIVHPSYFPKGIRPACILSCNKADALKLLNTKRLTDRSSQVGFSKFHYEQLTKFHYFKRLPLPEHGLLSIGDDPDNIQLHEDNSMNARLIRSIIETKEKQIELIRSSWNFNNRRFMTFYTDGSVQDVGLPGIKSGCAWIETSTVTPIEFSSAISNQWITSTKAELIAVLLALLVSSPNSEVHIYTDSKSVIDKFKSLAANVETFKYARDRFKDNYSTLWFSVFVVMESLNLKVIMHKVKAHNNNRFNDLTDSLAKAAVLLPVTISFNCNRRFKVAPMYKGMEIESNIRSFVKDVTTAREILAFVNQKRNIKYNKHRIDWLATTDVIKGDESSAVTSFSASYYKSKRVKLFLEELPTLDFLKATKPDLYPSDWMCPFCHTCDETFIHLWTCSHHLNLMEDITHQLKRSLSEMLALIVDNFDESNSFFQYIITHGSWWAILYDPFNITFVDFIKGVVPHDLSCNLNNITHNKDATLEILKSMYSMIFNLTQRIWLNRCKLIITKELAANIKGKHKRRTTYGSNSFSRSNYIDITDYQYVPDVLTDADTLINKMVTRGCHFSNF
jgi:ribonuclease HI